MAGSESCSCFGDGNFFAPGFRFHPTDEELVLYYLKRKICRMPLKIDIIGDTDVYKWDPEDLPGQSKLKTGDRQWFFFSPRDRKYPNGARSSRATTHGYWKATGKDRIITCNSRSVGMKKTLVFYRGRAPLGERTDWVMHEYTLDGEELKRCKAVKDCYALYKAFKKSGAGPKNGEQYGAPFKEEDWDHDCLNADGLFDKENSVKQINEVASVDNSTANIQHQFPLNDLDEYMNLPVLVPSVYINDDHVWQQLVAEEEDRLTLVDLFPREVNFPDQSIELPPSSLQNNAQDNFYLATSQLQLYQGPEFTPIPNIQAQASFDLTESTTAQLQVYETPELTCIPSIHAQEPRVAAGEGFLKDFLEMDDLLGSEPAIQSVDNPNLLLDERDGSSEFDVYHDADIFLCEMGQGNQVQNSQVYMNNPENGMVIPVPDSYLNNIQDNTLNYQLQNQSTVGNHMNCQPGSYDLRCSVFTPAEANQGTIRPNSGVECDGNFANLPVGANQNQNQSSKQDEDIDAWSSSIWAFVESIPTTPASASESSLVNTAFVRMSSFRRVRFNAVNTSLDAGNPTSTKRRSGRFSNLIIFFSFLGVLCAILWVFIGIHR